MVYFHTAYQTPTGTSGGSCVFSGTTITTSASGGFVCPFAVPSTPGPSPVVYGYDVAAATYTSFLSWTSTTPGSRWAQTSGAVG